MSAACTPQPPLQLSYGAILFLIIALGLIGCAPSNDSGDQDEPPPVVVENPLFPVLQSAVVVVAGGTARVPVDVGYRGAPHEFLSQVASILYTVEPSRDAYPYGENSIHKATYDMVAASFAISFGASQPIARTTAAEMTVAATSGISPGIYRFAIDVNSTQLTGGRFWLPAHQATAFAVVVLPTGDAISTGRVTAMAAGDAHTLALTDSGAVYAWGSNRRAQLGDGSVIDRAAPVRVLGLPDPAVNRVVGIAAGGNQSAAWMQDGTVWMWGDNGYNQIELSGIPLAREPIEGQCGISVLTSRRSCVPTPVVILRHFSSSSDGHPPINARAVPAVGAFHTLLIRSDGVVLGAGENGFNQLANSNGNFAPIDGIPAAVQVAAQPGASLVLLGDGSVWGWGRVEGLALAPTGSVQQTPIDIPLISQVTAIAAGDSFALALRSDRSVRAWGRNSSGQLGFGDRLSVNIANRTVRRTLIDPLEAVAIAAGRAHSLVLATDGGVYAWGENGSGQIGNGNAPDDRLAPELVLSLAGVAAIAAGGDHSIARLNACGQLATWGGNFNGELGHGNASASRDVPTLAYGLGEAALTSACEVMLRVYPEGNGTVASGSVVLAGGQGVITTCSAPASHCASRIATGGTITVTATPASGAQFDHWSGDCGGTNATVTVAMNHSKNCIAVFRASAPQPPAPVNLTVAIVGQGSVNSNVVGTADGIACPTNCTELYPADAIVVLTAAPASGFAFSAWSGTGCAATTAAVTVTMSVARSCTATFMVTVSAQWQRRPALNITLPTLPAFVSAPEVAMGAGDVPVVAFAENGVVVVRRLIAGAWSTVGTSLGNGNVATISLTVDSTDAPVVTWSESQSGLGNVYAARWNGSAWVVLGGAPVDTLAGNDAVTPTIRARSNNIALAWAENTATGLKIIVRTWNGTAWSNAGSTEGPAPTPTAYASANPKLAVAANDALAVAWEEDFGLLRVAELVNGVWTPRSSPLPQVTSGANFNLDIAYSTTYGLLVIAHQHGAAGLFAVRRWTGGAWSDLGTPRGNASFSGTPDIYGLAFSPGRSGATPLLAYSRRNRAGSVDEFVVERFNASLATPAWEILGQPINPVNRHNVPGLEAEIAVADGQTPTMVGHVRGFIPGSGTTDQSIVAHQYQ